MLHDKKNGKRLINWGLNWPMLTFVCFLSYTAIAPMCGDSRIATRGLAVMMEVSLPIGLLLVAVGLIIGGGWKRKIGILTLVLVLGLVVAAVFARMFGYVF